VGKQHVKLFLGAAWRKACPPVECFRPVKDSTSEDKGRSKGGEVEGGRWDGIAHAEGQWRERLSVGLAKSRMEPDIGKEKMKYGRRSVKSKLKGCLCAGGRLGGWTGLGRRFGGSPER